MAKIRLLVADDHALVRAGLRALLAAQPDLEVVGEADDGVVVVEQCRCLAPDVVLMDLTMPGRGGILAVEDLRASCPDTKVLIVTIHDDEAYARAAMLAGARGYVLKKAVAAELIAAIRAVHHGKQYLAASVAEAVGEPREGAGVRRSDKHGVESLTTREREVVSLVALGHTNTEVADRLHISEKTVETHRKNIVTKLGLRTRADLVRCAIEHGLMS